MNSIYEEVNCNFCGSSNYSIKHKPKIMPEDPEGLIASSWAKSNTQQIVTCKNCKLTYVNPRIKVAIIANAYRKSSNNELYFSDKSNRLKTFAKTIKFIEKLSMGRRGCLLDIGCASGLFLKCARDKGWETYGVELCKDFVCYGNEKYLLNIFAGTLKEANFQNDFFDFVTMWDVIEHLPDPMAELREINRIMKRSGYLLISFPDADSILAKVAGSKWCFYLSNHLYYFTPITITKMLRKCGFVVKVIKKYTPTISLGHLTELATTIYGDSLSRATSRLVRKLGVKAFAFSYYAGQKILVAQKVK